MDPTWIQGLPKGSEGNGALLLSGTSLYINKVVQGSFLFFEHLFEIFIYYYYVSELQQTRLMSYK